MGSDQAPSFKKRFYHVKVKNLELASLRELGQRMDQVGHQAFSKAYGKIWELDMVEVFVEAIASLAQYYDQSLRCFTFRDFQLAPTIEEFEGILGCPLGERKLLDFPCSYFLVHFFFIQICSREIWFAGKRTGSSSI